jgi:hypothetical protein
MPTRVTIPEAAIDEIVDRINAAPPPVPRPSSAGDREP